MAVINNPEQFSEDSSMNMTFPKDADVLKVYQTGEFTVVGFGGKDVPDEICVAIYRDQLAKLVEDFRCKALGFDMTGVKLVPSGMLGILTTMRKKVERVVIFNPSADVREVLELSRIAQLFEIKDEPFQAS